MSRSLLTIAFASIWPLSRSLSIHPGFPSSFRLGYLSLSFLALALLSLADAASQAPRVLFTAGLYFVCLSLKSCRWFLLSPFERLCVARPLYDLASLIAVSSL